MPGRSVLTLSLAAATAAAVLVGAPASAPAQEMHPLTAICASLRYRAEVSPVEIGLVAIDLEDGTHCTIGGHTVFRSASLYKLIVMAEAFEQAEAGAFAFDEILTIEPDHFRDDPPQMRPEGSFTLAADEAVRRMVTFSENSSTLVLIDRLGEAELQSAPGRLGLDGTVLDPAASFVTTAWDIATLLTALYRGEVVSNDASAAMMELLRAQELNDLIPQSLPPGIEVAHKTGLITEYLNDAGVIYAPGGDFVLVLLTRWDERIGQSYEAIHEFTALVYEAFAEPFERPPPPPPA
ncbi:MAG: serine hydrolase, partial [Dehalococcoidia bacterium]|nr:serine hydrolase [Dehalococcoidia bacterium]